MLAAEIEAEIDALASRYGAPRRVVADLAIKPIRPLLSHDRNGEVCMVVRRRNGKLLTAVKTYYPPGAFRLLTGGICHGERIEVALLRETAEETGLEVTVRRFLAVIEYRRATRGAAGTALCSDALDSSWVAPVPYSFATFAFLLDELGGTLGVQDADERIGAFHEVEVAELPGLADTLECAPDQVHPEVEGSWRDWGIFRAVTHRVVYDALRDQEMAGAGGRPLL